MSKAASPENLTILMSSRGRRRGGILTGTVLFILILAAGLSAQAAEDQDSPNWTLGLGVGTGHATIELNDFPSDPDWTRGATPRFSFGRLVGSNLIVGLEVRQWLNEGGFQEYKVRGNMQNVSLFLTWYPTRKTSRNGGFFVQGGGGFSHARVSGLEPIPGGNEWGETFHVIDKEDSGGEAVSFSLGYEFAVTARVGVGLSLSYNILWFDDGLFNKTEFVPGGLNLSWYF